MLLRPTSKRASLWKRFKMAFLQVPSLTTTTQMALEEEQRNLFRQEEQAAYAEHLRSYYAKRVEVLKAKLAELQNAEK